MARSLRLARVKHPAADAARLAGFPSDHRFSLMSTGEI